MAVHPLTRHNSSGPLLTRSEAQLACAIRCKEADRLPLHVAVGFPTSQEIWMRTQPATDRLRRHSPREWIKEAARLPIPLQPHAFLGM